MKRTLLWIAASAIAITAPLAAAPMSFYAVLNGPSESPANASLGTGLTQVIIDPTAHTLAVWLAFSNLTGTTTASHIHVITTPGAATGGVATTTPTFAGFPLGVTGGGYSNVLDTTLASSFNPSFVTLSGGLSQAEAALFAGITGGNAYLNIHSSVYPGGEIRGFLVPVPEPASGILLASGIAGLLYWRKKRASAIVV